MKKNVMSELERLQKENQMLKEQAFGRNQVEAKGKIVASISSRVFDLIPASTNKHERSTLKRRLMEDLKWHLRVRYASQFTEEHINPALQYINSWNGGAEGK